MKESVRRRLDRTVERFQEVGALLAEPDLAGGSVRFRELSVEYARLEPVAARYGEFRRLEADASQARESSAAARTSAEPTPFPSSAFR